MRVMNWLTNSTKYNKRVRPVNYSYNQLRVAVDLQLKSMLEVGYTDTGNSFPLSRVMMLVERFNALS